MPKTLLCHSDPGGHRGKNLARMCAGFAVGAFILAGQVYAGSLSVRIEQPKSPTNQNDITINFVALDLNGNTITAKCYKKGPTDGSFSQIDGDIGLASGGNSANCPTGSSVLSNEGTYLFYVNVTNGSESVDSAVVTVDYKTSGPGTPTNYSKDKIDDNTYKIHFRSADDSGKTVKVEIYRSTDTSFNLDDGTRVGSVAIGSNTDSDFLNDIPDTSKTYYYAVRAFDSAGNGSGVVGDSVTHTTTILPTTTPKQAIPVSSGTAGAGSVLGKSTGTAGATGTSGAMGEETPGVLGEATPTAVTPTPTNTPSGLLRLLGPFSGHPYLFGGGFVVLLGLIFYIIFL